MAPLRETPSIHGFITELFLTAFSVHQLLMNEEMTNAGQITLIDYQWAAAEMF